MGARFLLAVGLAATAWAGFGSAATREQPDFQSVRQHITRVMAERNLMSVAAAVSRGDRLLWAEAFGWADRETGRRATAETPYSLASISKPVTATALLSLVEDGRVDLDAPIDRYLGGAGLSGLAGPADQATVRRVLSHTAGLPLHYQFFYEHLPERAPPMADAIARYGILVTPPGTVYEYSNIGYGILGHAVTETAGQPLDMVLRARVFDPLGMPQSAAGASDRFTPRAALRYDAAGRAIPYYTTDHPGASEIYASARDLARFGMFHLGHDPAGHRPPLSRDARARMQQAATPDAVSPAYGMGWFITDEFGFRKVYHTGSMPGVSTMLALYPEHDVAVVVLLNSLDREQRVEIAREIVALVIPGYAEARRASPAGRTAGVGRTAEALSGLWSGTLRTWRGAVPLELRAGDGRVFARLDGAADEVTIRNARVTDARLTGRFRGSLDVPDLTRAARYEIALDLRRSGERLTGAATAVSIGEPTLFNLTSFVDLRAVR